MGLECTKTLHKEINDAKLINTPLNCTFANKYNIETYDKVNYLVHKNKIVLSRYRNDTQRYRGLKGKTNNKMESINCRDWCYCPPKAKFLQLYVRNYLECVYISSNSIQLIIIDFIGI